MQSEQVPKEVVSWVSKLKPESIVEIYGVVSVAAAKIESATQQDVEIEAAQIFRLSKSEKLPIQVEDCMRKFSVLEKQNEEMLALEELIQAAASALESKESSEEKKGSLRAEIEILKKRRETGALFPVIDQATRLDNRVIDLRTPANIAIFKLQSGVCRLFREFLHERGFTEIHSPKLIGAASEGGADVFEVSYFKTKAYLAQSPQFYKQMAITSDFERVFEIGPVFRAERAFTARHLTEFTGLDLEMTFKQHYHEVMNLIGEMFISIFKGLEKAYARELQVFAEQFEFEPLIFSEKPLVLTYPEAVTMLREAGAAMGDLEDLSTPNEKLLGRLVKAKYNTDFYILDKYPTQVRAFYSMPSAENPNYANAYDMFVRGEEVLSGAQRINEPTMLLDAVRARGINPESIQGYIDAFKYGAPPHAGGGVGLERLVMLYLNTHNIRKSTLFPRDPQRLTP